LHIRPATSADIPALMALEAAATTAAHWSREQYETALGDSAPQRVVLVLEKETRLEGFLVARVLGREWEVENIVVSNRSQRQGLGARLLDALLRHAHSQDAESIILEVRESNLAAKALYQKCGFSEIGRRPRYYREPAEDALLYRRVAP
jgi:[ribosomal protein S18]-alanine N-acetyltransferase